MNDYCYDPRSNHSTIMEDSAYRLDGLKHDLLLWFALFLLCFGFALMAVLPRMLTVYTIPPAETPVGQLWKEQAND